LFRASAYQTLIKANGEQNIQSYRPISIDEIRVVDEDLAHLLGKALGSQPHFRKSSRAWRVLYSKVKNDLYWVALLHSGFFKWMNNRNGRLRDGFSSMKEMLDWFKILKVKN
jgi:hypothetical protein